VVSAARMVTSLQDCRLNSSSIPGRARDLSPLQIVHAGDVTDAYIGRVRVQSGRKSRVTSLPSLGLRLIRSGAIALPPYAFLLCTGVNMTFTVKRSFLTPE